MITLAIKACYNATCAEMEYITLNLKGKLNFEFQRASQVQAGRE